MPINADELLRVRDNKSYKSMPQNVINNVSDILCPVYKCKYLCVSVRNQILAPNLGMKRAKFSMDRLMRFKGENICQNMPDSD